MYTFFIKADKGAFLRIHDATVIDADFGYVGGSERSSKIKLKAGLHPIKLYYTNQKGNNSLPEFKWKRESIFRETVPSDVFYH
jgi:hypothetical protein